MMRGLKFDVFSYFRLTNYPSCRGDFDKGDLKGSEDELRQDVKCKK